MQNDVATRDCQEYVLDVMEQLEISNFLGNWLDYEMVKGAIEDMRGDIDSTRRFVLSYNNRSSQESREDDHSDDSEAGDDEPKNIRSAELIVNSSDEESINQDGSDEER